MGNTCELNKREAMVYDAIVEWISKHGYSPTLREIGIKVGIDSTSTIYYIIKNLELKGYIDAARGKRRAIALPSKPPIVHCKHCKYRHKTNMGIGIWMVCHKLNRKTEDDFYCAYGEVKDK